MLPSACIGRTVAGIRPLRFRVIGPPSRGCGPSVAAQYYVDCRDREGLLYHVPRTVPIPIASRRRVFARRLRRTQPWPPNPQTCSSSAPAPPAASWRGGLSEAGFRVVCLEQGDWHDKAEYRGAELDWELTMRKQWSTSPNVRGLAEDYPIDDSDAAVSPLMFSAVGGSMLIFAGAWPRMLPSDFRVRSLDGVADDWPLTYEELRPYYERTDRDFGVSGMGGDPAYPPGGEDPPLPPLPIGAGGLKVARAHTRLGWHWWPEPNSILSVPYDGRRPCVQRGTCQQGCGEGAKASTDLTHWPKAIAAGARLVTGARVRRLETNAAGLVTGATWLDRGRRRALRAGQGRRPGGQRDRHGPAAAAVGVVRAHPDGLANSSGLVGRRLMMHPFANVAGLFDEDLESWQGQFGCSIESFEFYETDERRGLRPRRQVGPGPDLRPDQRGAAEPGRLAGLGPGPSPPRPVAPRTRRQLGPVRRGPARRGQPRDPVPEPDRLVRDPGTRAPLHGCRRTRAGCSTSTSRRRRSRCSRPGRTPSRSTG